MTNQSSRRAALRVQQEAEDRANRTKRILIGGSIVAAVAVVAVIAIVLAQALGRGSATAQQQTPPNASAEHGIYVSGKARQAGTPHLVVWEDYQCGGCAGFEADFGGHVQQLVADGKITAEHRQAYFLDAQAAYGPSRLAALAAASADAVGHFDDYHSALFQTLMGGQRYDARLLRETLPTTMGWPSDEVSRFQTLFDEKAFDTFTREAHDSFKTQGIGSTPTLQVDGKEVPYFDAAAKQRLIEPTADALLAAIVKTAGQ